IFGGRHTTVDHLHRHGLRGAVASCVFCCAGVHASQGLLACAWWCLLQAENSLSLVMVSSRGCCRSNCLALNQPAWRQRRLRPVPAYPAHRSVQQSRLRRRPRSGTSLRVSRDTPCTSVEGRFWGADHCQATQLSSGGYPNRYTAKAGNMLPILANGTPDHDDMSIIGDDDVMPAGWKGHIILHRDRIAAGPADQVLTIEVRDLS